MTTAAQILNLFGIEINDHNKSICPFHEEDTPSLQVNEDFVYCYGCGASYDIYELPKKLLNKPMSFREVVEWIANTEFPEDTLTYDKSSYIGPVNTQLIDYWHSCLLESGLIPTLYQERLLTEESIRKFKLGYRPDHNAWVIPYLHNGLAEIVQFRSRDKKEYYGLKNHQRGSFTNADILDRPQNYVVVLMGAFDGLLASQDGLIVVGQNGSFPFKKSEKERIQQIFSKQKIKFIVPDNTPDEFRSAEKLAKWIDGEVKYFPETLPPDTDYIDYRKLGFTVEDFKRDVLGIIPDQTIPNDLTVNLIEFYQIADVKDLAGFYLDWLGKGISYHNVALELSKHLPNEWERLYNVRCEQDLLNVIQFPKGDW